MKPQSFLQANAFTIIGVLLAASVITSTSFTVWYAPLYLIFGYLIDRNRRNAS